MDAEILFPKILYFGIQNVKISRAKRRRLKKKANRSLSFRGDDMAVPAADGLSWSVDGMYPMIGDDKAVKKRKPEPNQLSDVLPAVEDEDSVKRKSVSSSEQLAPLVAFHTIVADTSLLLIYFSKYFSACTQDSSNPPGSDLFDDEGLFCYDVHCSAETRLGAKGLKQVREGIIIEFGFGLVTPRLKRKPLSNSIVDGH